MCILYKTNGESVLQDNSDSEIGASLCFLTTKPTNGSKEQEREFLHAGPGRNSLLYFFSERYEKKFQKKGSWKKKRGEIILPCIPPGIQPCGCQSFRG